MAYVQDGQRSLIKNTYVFDDCLNKTAWDGRNSGTGSANDVAGVDANHPGVFRLSTGSTSGGVASINYTSNTGSNTGAWIFGGGSFTWTGYFNIATLATVSDDYDYYIGLHDGWQFGRPSNGIYFQYSRSTSVNWQIVCNNSGTNTATTTSTAVSTGWHKFVIVGTTSAVTFYVDGVSLGTISTNLPTGTIPLCGHAVFKTAGTSNLLFYQDYFEFEQTLTNSR